MLKVPYKTNDVTREDIPLFFEALKVHLPLMRCLTAAQDDLVMCAELKKQDSRLLVATVKMYRSEPVTAVEVIWGKHVPVMRDWMQKKYLWFRMYQGQPDAFIEYMDTYRKDFKVNQQPIMAFTVTV
jgi:hypothetical protein